MREESLKLAATRCKPLDTPMFKEEYYRVKTTGAIVTLSSGVALIYFYCAKLPSDGYAFPIFLYYFISLHYVTFLVDNHFSYQDYLSFLLLDILNLPRGLLLKSLVSVPCIFQRAVQ